jgi:hypothetical protein
MEDSMDLRNSGIFWDYWANLAWVYRGKITTVNRVNLNELFLGASLPHLANTAENEVL